MSKTRDEYLQKHWSKYPEMPRGALRWGRVEQQRLGVQILTQWKFKDGEEFYNTPRERIYKKGI